MEEGYVGGESFIQMNNLFSYPWLLVIINKLPKFETMESCFIISLVILMKLISEYLFSYPCQYQ